MAEENDPIEVLETHLTGLADTHRGVVGLIEKIVGIQSALAEAGHTKFSEALSEPFGALSGVPEQIQELQRLIELERNRMRNEA